MNEAKPCVKENRPARETGLVMMDSQTCGQVQGLLLVCAVHNTAFLPNSSPQGVHFPLKSVILPHIESSQTRRQNETRESICVLGTHRSRLGCKFHH